MGVIPGDVETPAPRRLRFMFCVVVAVAMLVFCPRKLVAGLSSFCNSSNKQNVNEEFFVWSF